MRYSIARPVIGDLEKALVNVALDEVALTQGKRVRRLENILAEYLRVKHVLAVSSGTTALHLVLASLGIGPGDEVLVPDLTFVATANAVAYTGATPVVVDVNPVSWCMDMVDAHRKLTPRTKAAIPVHLYGISADMSHLPRTAIVEDAAEGFTGSWGGKMLGTIGRAGIFSFFGNKIMTTGEGGAIATNDTDLYNKMYHLRNGAHDPNRRYYHTELGFNYRMTDIQAAIGIAQMSRLPEMLERRREIFEVYQTRLCYDHGVIPVASPNSRPAPWIFTLQLNREISRDGLMARLAQRGIETRPGFVPMHRLPMYQSSDKNFPVASRISERLISLPTHPGLTVEDIHTICDEFIACA